MNLFWKKLPATEKLENDFQEKKRIYRDLLETDSSEELKEYNELLKTVTSTDFQKKKNEIERLNYKKTDQFQKEKWLEKMDRRKDVKDYLAMKDSKELNEYLAFKDTDEYVKVADKESRKENVKLENFFKFERSKSFVNYSNLNASDEIKKYLETKAEVESKEFKDYKAFCLDKNRWQTTEEGKLEQRFDELENLPKIEEYLSYKDLPDLNFFKEWELVFEDSFSDKIVDPTKWISIPLWGKRQNVGAYSLYNEAHALSEQAIKLDGNSLKMVVEPKAAEGKAWHSERGFVPKKFTHQAAMVNTGDHFSQQFGRIEAKIRMDGKMPVGHAFYLCTEDNSEQITIMKSLTHKRFNVGVQHQNKHKVTSKDALVKGKKIFNYHIVAVEWNKEEINWFLNGIKIHTESSTVPHQPMYLAFSSFVSDKAKSEIGEMEIDWVRVYAKAN